MPASKSKTSPFYFPSGFEIDFGIIYPWLLSQKAANSCLACRTKHPERIRRTDWEKGKECESRVGMSSGSQESCSPVRGLGVGRRARCHSGGGRGVGDRWGVDCVCVCVWVCVCDWSAVAGDLLWRGGMREGLTRLGCPWSADTHTDKHTHTLIHSLPHSQGSETLQIETSPLCPPRCSLDLIDFWIRMSCSPAEGLSTSFSDGWDFFFRKTLPS